MKFSTILFCCAIMLPACTSPTGKKYRTWEAYGGGNDNLHYSSLNDIDTNNVKQLKPVWQFRSGDADTLSQIQVNPVVVNGILYGVSPKLKLFALDAATGEKKWLFDPMVFVDTAGFGKWYFAMNVCRGISFYNGGKNDQRIFYAAGPLLYCIDAATGRPVPAFGRKGAIDLHDGLGRDVKDLYVAATSPGRIYKDLLIVGTRVAEEDPAAPGHIRAYDVHTGKLRWIFHTIPQPGEAGYESWDDKESWRYIGGANAWAGFSLDEERGILFAPTGSATYDFYGGRRPGNNLFANCVLALDAATGKLIWHYQTVHHDVWDRDLPTAPLPVSIMKEGKRMEAVAQVTKSGYIFLLDRQNGKPIYPVAEMPAPVNTELEGERLSPTQPVPTFPAPFARQVLNEDNLNRLGPDSSYEEIKQRLSGYVSGNLFAPPSRKGTVVFPGFDGGAEWGGPAFDPTTGWLYVNANEIPWILTMVNNKGDENKLAGKTMPEAGKAIYSTNCMSCHGPNREGSGNNPSLTGIGKRYDEAAFMQLVSTGRRMMPAFKQLAEEEKEALASFVLGIRSKQGERYKAPANKTSPAKGPFTSTGYNKFLNREGYPAIAPPWGTLSAIDLNTGRLCWRDTLGDYPEFRAKGIHTGTENYGGPVVTAGGVLFIAATRDGMLRAFNKRTGALLWETALPAPGFATPAVYKVNGKQYLVIACGGGKLKTKSADVYMAFGIN